MKVGVIGKHVPALAAPPTRQPNLPADHGVAYHHTQPARTDIMRSEAPGSVAPGAVGAIANALHTFFLHSAIVILDFSYSRGRFLVDERTPCMGRSDDPRETPDLAPPFLCASRPSQTASETRGGVPEILYPGGIKSGVRGGLKTDKYFQNTADYPGQSICDAAAAASPRCRCRCPKLLYANATSLTTLPCPTVAWP